MGERKGGKLSAGNGEEIAPVGLEAGIAELQGRQFLGKFAVMTHHRDLVEQRHTVKREALCGKEMLIEVDQVVATGQNVGVGLGGYFDAGTSPHRPELKTRAVVRKGVGPILVQEPRLDQKLGISWVTMVHVTDLGKIELVPTVRAIRLNGIPLVQIFDTVAEGVEGAGQFPAEDVMGFER